LRFIKEQIFLFAFKPKAKRLKLKANQL